MRKVIQTDKAALPLGGAYSQGWVAGNLVFTAGQLGLAPGKPRQLVAGGVAEQTRQALENIKAILESAGTGMDRVVKTSVFLTDLADFAGMNGVYTQYFNAGSPPCRTTVQVVALAFGALVEIEAIAAVE